MNTRQIEAMWIRIDAAVSQMENAMKILERHDMRIERETAADCRMQANALRRDAKAFLPKRDQGGDEQ